METSCILEQNTVLEIQQKLQKALLTMDQTPKSAIQLKGRLEEIIQSIYDVITTDYLEDESLLKLFNIFDFCTNYLEKTRLSVVEEAKMLKEANYRISA